MPYENLTEDKFEDFEDPYERYAYAESLIPVILEQARPHLEIQIAGAEKGDNFDFFHEASHLSTSVRLEGEDWTATVEFYPDGYMEVSSLYLPTNQSDVGKIESYKHAYSPWERHNYHYYKSPSAAFFALGKILEERAELRPGDIEPDPIKLQNLGRKEEEKQRKERETEREKAKHLLEQLNT